MKKTLSVLALSLSSTVAMADIITFEGTVKAPGTCPVEVVTPGGPLLPLVLLGDFKTTAFNAVGQETPDKQFALRIPASCVTGTQSAYTTFTANHNPDKDNPDLYALKSGIGYTTGLALAIDDKATRLPPGTESAGYELKNTGHTDVVFLARLVTTKPSVTEGHIDTSISFDVDIR
ncbi:fimbrial protein [Pseudomonas sp. p21]|uniref:fimbrial protein n=1 Tax=Pseudomonas sp. p21 TaxID=1825979 RepID=UPI000AB23E7D|nr:fimbrial protein [Pseudomonas sp. p21]